MLEFMFPQMTKIETQSCVFLIPFGLLQFKTLLLVDGLINLKILFLKISRLS